MSPSKLLDDTGNDTDRDNQEVAIVARRPSRAMSPFDRPRSPTPNDSQKDSTNIEPPSSINDNRTMSPTLNDNQQDGEKHKEPTDIVAPSSRRESTAKIDQQQTSRPTSAMKTKPDDNSFEPLASRASSSRTNQFSVTDEQSKLITPSEQLQIPTNISYNDRLNSPPLSPTGAQSLVLINPLLESNLVQTEQERSRPSSATNRKSPTASIVSNEKVIDGDIVSPPSRRESNISQQQTNVNDQKSTR
jgi:hypothetical protein